MWRMKTITLSNTLPLEKVVQIFLSFTFLLLKIVSLTKSILSQLARGQVKILELLIKGDNINDFNKDGKSLLHLSIEKGTFSIFSGVFSAHMLMQLY